MYFLGISLFVADSFALLHIVDVVAELMSAVLNQQGYYEKCYGLGGQIIKNSNL
jgi:hypothetical protein